MRTRRWMVKVVLVSVGVLAGGAVALAAGDAAEDAHSHEAALSVVTGDPVLKEQIVKVEQALEGLHQQMAQSREMIRQAAGEAQQAAAYAQLDGLRRQHDMLEGLLHDLVEEATATEWTKIDAALQAARSYERVQEHAYRKEEALRDRQK